MNSYKFLTNVMYEGFDYRRDSVYKLTEELALNFGDTVVQVQEVPAPVTDTVGNDASEKKVAPAHPNKMLNAKKATKK